MKSPPPLFSGSFSKLPKGRFPPRRSAHLHPRHVTLRARTRARATPGQNRMGGRTKRQPTERSSTAKQFGCPNCRTRITSTAILREISSCDQEHSRPARHAIVPKAIADQRTKNLHRRMNSQRAEYRQHGGSTVPPPRVRQIKKPEGLPNRQKHHVCDTIVLPTCPYATHGIVFSVCYTNAFTGTQLDSSPANSL